MAANAYSASSVVSPAHYIRQMEVIQGVGSAGNCFGVNRPNYYPWTGLCVDFGGLTKATFEDGQGVLARFLYIMNGTVANSSSATLAIGRAAQVRFNGTWYGFQLAKVTVPNSPFFCSLCNRPSFTLNAYKATDSQLHPVWTELWVGAGLLAAGAVSFALTTVYERRPGVSPERSRKERQELPLG